VTIRIEEPSDGVRLLTIHRPERRNAIDLATYRALTAAIDDADRDPEVRCCVLTGAGNVFTEAVRYLRPVDNEQNAPVSRDDRLRWAIDQDTSDGVFSRLSPQVKFSHTPSKAWRPTALPLHGAENFAWAEAPLGWDDPLAVPHGPADVVRDGRLLDFPECYGIEDRGDGGGDVSFFSPGIAKLAEQQAMEL
jgi:hypothetical protein